MNIPKIELILDLFLPNQCMLCNKHAKDVVCRKCLNRLSPEIKVFNNSDHIDSVVSLFPYNDAFKKLLSLLKFQKHKTIGDLLCRVITKNLNKLTLGPVDLWVPVPIHLKRLKSRGYNQVDLLFYPAIQSINGVYLPLVSRIKNTDHLFELSSEERIKMLNNAFEVCDSVCLKNKHVMILDDIFTSGATISEIAKLLKKHNAKKVSALTFTYVL
jgi:competence protein ComFC